MNERCRVASPARDAAGSLGSAATGTGTAADAGATAAAASAAQAAPIPIERAIGAIAALVTALVCRVDAASVIYTGEPQRRPRVNKKKRPTASTGEID